MTPGAAVVTAAVAVLAGTVLTLLVLRRRYLVISVDGISMRPTLEPGDRILVRRSRTAARGQIVVVPRPDPATGWRGGSADGWYVKRAVAVAGDPVPGDVAAACPADLGAAVPPGQMLVVGDNPRSDDSKQWGYCPEKLLIGVHVRTLAGTRRNLSEEDAT